MTLFLVYFIDGRIMSYEFAERVEVEYVVNRAVDETAEHCIEVEKVIVTSHYEEYKPGFIKVS